MQAYGFQYPRFFGNAASPGKTWYADFGELWFSVGHRRLPNGGWSGGGPVFIRKLKHDPGAQYGPFHCVNANNVSNTFSCGTVLVPCPQVTTLNFPIFSEAQAKAERDTAAPYYATGWARTRPGRPEANVFNFLMELRNDGFPVIPAWRLMRTLKGTAFASWPSVIRDYLRHFMNLKNLGHNYLNVEFGWKPFIKDLQDVYNLMFSVDRQMAQIVRDNGRSIRRKATLSETNVTTILAQGANPSSAFVNVQGVPPVSFNGASSVWYKTQTVREKVWYAAAYRYYIPDTSSWAWNATARALLFGALPTPEAVYNSLPWTWLVDWFSNVGDVISNYSSNAVDNLIALYSFVMRETEVTMRGVVETSHAAYSFESSGGNVWRWEAFNGRFESTTTITMKRRVSGGNPYGLSSSWTSLTGRQLAILAALGVTRD